MASIETELGSRFPSVALSTLDFLCSDLGPCSSSLISIAPSSKAMGDVDVYLTV